MKTKEQMVQEAIRNLRNHNHTLAANKLEKAIEKGTIDLILSSHYNDRFIYAALIFAGMDAKIRTISSLHLPNQIITKGRETCPSKPNQNEKRFKDRHQI